MSTPRKKSSTPAQPSVSTPDVDLRPTEPADAKGAEARDRTDWRATAEVWEEATRLRFRRGWQWAALSLGIRPARDAISELPGDQAKAYRSMIRVIRNSTTELRSSTKLQYEKNMHGAVTPSNDPKYFLFDGGKFVRFLQQLPNTTVDPNLLRVASAWGVGAEVKSKPTPSRIEKAAKTRVEGTLYALLLGLLMEHHKYIPPGLPGASRDAAVQAKLADNIVAVVARWGLDLSKPVVLDRLSEAKEFLDSHSEAVVRMRSAIEARKKAQHGPA